MAKVSKRRHKDDTATFKELNLKQQSSSIKVTIMNLKNAILAHGRKADRDTDSAMRH
jgi:hypothetical protein